MNIDKWVQARGSVKKEKRKKKSIIQQKCRGSVNFFFHSILDLDTITSQSISLLWMICRKVNKEAGGWASIVNQSNPTGLQSSHTYCNLCLFRINFLTFKTKHLKQFLNLARIGFKFQDFGRVCIYSLWINYRIGRLTYLV